MFSGAGDGVVRQWDAASGATVALYTGHTGGVSAILVDGDWLASGSADGTIRAWNLVTDQPAQVILPHGGGLVGAVRLRAFALCR